MDHEHKGEVKTQVTITPDPDFSALSLPDLLAIREHRQQVQEHNQQIRDIVDKQAEQEEQEEENG